ncbi:MAG: tyrosine-type recombinase/integrase [Acaryochloris sp. RU_4_1]|nr:tyrosine-type recombinase/integrase [Acaryochloris sp. SU_5_25]NJM68312.1 tyrosine-type recombinase/integrase [Acaryochloris sp. RU_4_1]NJR57220.1 tyrosine-type recombinase/integrase [Acaryochloris sp. CRU_2_0]
MAIPTVKLISVTPPTIPKTSDKRSRKTGRSPSPLSPSAPADLRWSRVEEFFCSRELRPNTRKSYERAFRAFLNWTDKGSQDITARDIDRYKEYLKALPSERGGQRSPATINLALAALQSLFKWLCSRDYIAKDPMLLIEMLKPDPVLSQEWSADEVKRLLAATKQRGQTAQRDRALLWVLLHGLRAREVEALNLADFDGQRLHIREAKDDSVGQVPLLSEAISALQGYLNARDEGMGSESPLFVSESNNSKGQRLSYWGIYKVVKDLAAIAGVEDSHPHRGRHTVATQMVSRGMNPLLARQITRHKSERSFERYSKRALQMQAEEQFLQLFADGQAGETPGGEDAMVYDRPEVIALEAVVEEPLKKPPVKAAEVPQYCYFGDGSFDLGRARSRCYHLPKESDPAISKCGATLIDIDNPQSVDWIMEHSRILMCKRCFRGINTRKRKESAVEEPSCEPQIKPVAMPLNVVQVGLKLWVSGRKKGKVRRAIEDQVLSPFQMVKLKPRGNMYELTFVFEEEGEIAGIVSQVRWEMDLLADLDDCSVQVVWLGDVCW